MINDRILEEIYRLKNLVRYNNRTKLKEESVAEHSFYVALLSLMICDELKLDDRTTFESLIKAILHDMPEIEMNDITYDVKTRLRLTEILQKYEEEYYDCNFKSFAHLMNLSDDSVSSTVVNLADALSVRQFIQNEKNLGNHSRDILEIENECSKRIDDLEIELYKKTGGKKDEND